MQVNKELKTPMVEVARVVRLQGGVMAGLRLADCVDLKTLFGLGLSER